MSEGSNNEIAAAKRRYRSRTSKSPDLKEAAGPLNRELILQAAYHLAHTTPLQDVSIALVSKHLGVSPGLIHYYVGTREWLTSGVMNKFYEIMYNSLPQPSSDWQETLISAAKTMYKLWIEVPGITKYVVGDNAYRTFQLVDSDTLDYGLEVIERFTVLIRRAGSSKKKTGLYAHLIKDFIVSAALAHVTHAYPSQHRELIVDRTAKIARARYPALFYTKDSLIALDAEEAFMIGLHSFLLGLQSEDPALG